jgi:hypothetical protein
MTDPELSPTYESPVAPLRDASSPDEIELPPIADAYAADASWSDPSREGSDTGDGRATRNRSSGNALLAGVLLAAGIAVGGWLMMRGGSAEMEHPNWEHVTAAGEASLGGDNQVVRVVGPGMTEILPSMELSYRDGAPSMTRKIRGALAKGDVSAATTLLQAAQSIPVSDPATQSPEIVAGSTLEAALKDRRSELFEIHLSDSCAEDGDVVEVLVNDAPFAVVPISHAGMMLSIPLRRGHNTVTLRGVQDGGGGITVSFQTSRGTYFCRSMFVGEEYRMGVSVK